MTKKGHQNFWRMKIENFCVKVKSGKFSKESGIFSRNRGGGNLKQGEIIPEMHHCLRGMDAPGDTFAEYRTRTSVTI